MESSQTAKVPTRSRIQFVGSTCKVPFRRLFDDFAMGQRQQNNTLASAPLLSWVGAIIVMSIVIVIVIVIVPVNVIVIIIIITPEPSLCLKLNIDLSH